MKNFSVDMKGNRLALYDHSTYAECSFDCIYREGRDIWPRVQQSYNAGNLLLVYFEQSPLSRNVFLNEYFVDKFIKSENNPTINETDLGMLQRAIISTLQTVRQ